MFHIQTQLPKNAAKNDRRNLKPANSGYNTGVFDATYFQYRAVITPIAALNPAHTKPERADPIDHISSSLVSLNVSIIKNIIAANKQPAPNPNSKNMTVSGSPF